MTKEYEIENWLIERLKDLKYIHSPCGKSVFHNSKTGMDNTEL